MKEKNRQLSAVIAVSTAVSQSLELREVLKLAADKTLEVTGVKAAWIYLVDEAAGKLVLSVASGLSRATLKEARTLNIGHGASGLVAQTGEPILVADLASDPRVTLQTPKVEGWKSIACVPLKYHGRVIGVLGGTNRNKGALDEKDMAMLQAIGNVIAPAIRNAQLYQNLKELAITDGLSGLYNRRFMEVELERELARTRRTGEPLSLIMSDVDKLKAVNDKFGHAAGDQLLKDVGELLRGTVRLSDLVARYGGDEFAILLPATKPTEALTVAQRIVSRLASYRLQAGGEEISVSLSLGIAAYPQDASEPKELLHRADQAMYKAKKSQKHISLYSNTGMVR